MATRLLAALKQVPSFTSFSFPSVAGHHTCFLICIPIASFCTNRNGNKDIGWEGEGVERGTEEESLEETPFILPQSCKDFPIRCNKDNFRAPPMHQTPLQLSNTESPSPHATPFLTAMLVCRARSPRAPALSWSLASQGRHYLLSFPRPSSANARATKAMTHQPI